MTALPDRACSSHAEPPQGLPEWMRPPRDEGWFAEDLDALPEAPPHTELIDGALVFTMSPQRIWHARMLRALANALSRQAPEETIVEEEMTVRLDKRNRPEPDVVVATGELDLERTSFEAGEVALVIEVVSAESAHRDRKVKPRKYAEAGIRHFWRVEDENGKPVVHAYELDETTGSYAPIGIFRERLKLDRPFPIRLDLDRLIADQGLS